MPLYTMARAGSGKWLSVVWSCMLPHAVPARDNNVGPRSQGHMPAPPHTTPSRMRVVSEAGNRAAGSFHRFFLAPGSPAGGGSGDDKDGPQLMQVCAALFWCSGPSLLKLWRFASCGPRNS